MDIFHSEKCSVCLPGDAVPGLEGGHTNQPAIFTVETRGAGQGGLGLAIEGPSEAKMNCRDNRDGSCTVEYLPTKPGDYDIAIKFADRPIPGQFMLLLWYIEQQQRIKSKFHLARHVTSRHAGHIRRVEPMHFGCVELVEQHGSTLSWNLGYSL